MTVNYTTNLSLGQPVTGTESGTWGEDVNNSVTSYLDIAISGSLALTSASFTSNALTLVNTQGTSSVTNIGVTTAQYYVLRLSSLAASVTITAPSVSKTYLVVNADATYSVTVKALGQTGVSVVAGEKAVVYYNGTDYIKITSSVVSNLTGTLPIANGGTNSTATPTNGGIGYGTGTAHAYTAAGTAGQVVVSAGAAAPAFGVGTATTPVVVTFSATAMTVNCALSNVFTTTMTANVTVAPTLSNPIDGQTINWFITQDATGSRTITWPTSFKWAGGFTQTLSTTASAVDLLVATYRSSTGFWYASLAKGFA